MSYSTVPLTPLFPNFDDYNHPHPRYSLSQEQWLFWGTKPTTLLSILSSVVIIYILIRDRSTHLVRVFGRLWLFLSAGNIVICCMTLIAQLAAPAETHVYAAFGTPATCVAAAAIFHFWFALTMVYNAALGLYYYISGMIHAVLPLDLFGYCFPAVTAKVSLTIFWFHTTLQLCSHHQME